jgi:hypothetical protein
LFWFLKFPLREKGQKHDTSDVHRILNRQFSGLTRSTLHVSSVLGFTLFSFDIP